jgi:hypothetical protein
MSRKRTTWAAVVVAGFSLAVAAPGGALAPGAEFVFTGTMAVTPTTVEQGTPVTLSGTGCLDGEVAINVHPGEGIDAQADAAGDWSVQVGTSTLGFGTNTIEAACTMGGSVYPYEAVEFTVVAPATTAPPTVAPTPLPAQPRLTG